MERIDRPRWRKSSYSGSNGGDCVEVADHAGRVLVQDTKDRSGPVLSVSAEAWRRFAGQVKRALARQPWPRPADSCRGTLMSRVPLHESAGLGQGWRANARFTWPANRRQASALTLRTGPERSLVSCTSTRPAWSATSTQSPPLLPL